MESTLFSGDYLLCHAKKPKSSDIVIFLQEGNKKKQIKRCFLDPVHLEKFNYEKLKQNYLLQLNMLSIDSISIILNYSLLQQSQIIQVAPMRYIISLTKSELQSIIKIDAGISVDLRCSKFQIPLSLMKDEVLVIGDNRPHSIDSRHYGPISKECIIGKTTFVLFNYQHGRFLRDRFFKKIQ